MDWILPIILSYCAAPAICYYYFGRFCSRPTPWYGILTCTGLSFLLSINAESMTLWGIAAVLVQMVPFILYGMLCLKLKSITAFTISSLLISVLSVARGLIESLKFFTVSCIDASAYQILLYMDLFGSIICILLLFLCLHIIYKGFCVNPDNLHNSAFLLLGLPVLFISIVEATVSSEIYGDTIIWDNLNGLIYPNVNAIELFILQIFAFVGLFSVIAAFRRLNQVIQNEQTIRLLAQQTHQQENYIQEAQSRYHQTRAFRHDIKNHLLVLKKLLANENTEEALHYLSNLDQMSDTLSLPVHTGNPVVDALLGSKLAVAMQQEIQTDCKIRVPESGTIKDIDWCIILSNAMDNGINANLLVPVGSRYLRLVGKQKGNFYFLYLENRCLEMTETPSFGTGLSNMKNTVEKYNGTLEMEVCKDIFKLNILLIIPQS